MRLDLAVVALTLLAPAWAAAVEPGLHGSDVAFLAPKSERDNTQQDEKLWKRKGGGGGGGGRGGGSSSAYGGGRYYGGGATVPYSAGARRGNMVPFLLVGGALAFWPGLWLGAHMYPYSHPYRYYNETARQNQTKPVLCGCQEYQPCGCDENNSTEYMNSLLGNGSYAALNKSVVNIGEYNGNETILINGSLPNGTTAAGGSDEVGSAAFRTAVETLGFWPVVVVVLATVFAA
ncbi:hypothetical protein COL5a_011359 [Colletotrichum fioriniae]|nr:hypothetical protein COL5a_011359 [Colletotrichum fioriniae]